MRILLKKRNWYKQSVFWGVTVFIISNTYFGWNKEAQSGAERICDFVWQVLIFGVCFGGQFMTQLKQS